MIAAAQPANTRQGQACFKPGDTKLTTNSAASVAAIAVVASSNATVSAVVAAVVVSSVGVVAIPVAAITPVATNSDIASAPATPVVVAYNATENSVCCSCYNMPANNCSPETNLGDCSQHD